jgi:hypothetical protein
MTDRYHVFLEVEDAGEVCLGPFTPRTVHTADDIVVTDNDQPLADLLRHTADLIDADGPWDSQCPDHPSRPAGRTDPGGCRDRPATTAAPPETPAQPQRVADWMDRPEERP